MDLPTHPPLPPPASPPLHPPASPPLHPPPTPSSPPQVKNVQNILATNVSVCGALGQPFASQLALIYVDMLAVYK